MSRFKLNTQKAADIVTTAFEGGINYWCQSASYTNDDLASDIRSRNDGYPAYAEPEYWEGGGMLVEEDEDGTQTLLSLDKLNEALENPELPMSAAMRILQGDGSADAKDADLIVQVALFGKVVYG
jgi:hypothetical protein